MDQDQSYPADAGADIFLLTVLGVAAADTFPAARELHNATAGAPQSVAGARSLGDLSHNVFLPAEDSAIRLLFLDTWNSPTGVGQFFGNPQVAEAAGQLFSERQATLWTRATGFGSYVLPTPSGRGVAGVGYVRAPVTSIDAAQSAFHAASVAQINRARAAGQVAHQLWLPVPMPGAAPTQEVLGLDYWLDVDQMIDFYNHGDFELLAPVFAGAPDAGTFKTAGSDWIEW